MRLLTTVFSLIIILAVGGWFFISQRSQKEGGEKKDFSAQLAPGTVAMKISSSAFTENSTIPKKYTCDGDNVNPPLQFSDIPEGTESLVLIVDDPDAPAKVWSHWVLSNIPPTTTEIAENSVPEGAVQGKNDFGKVAYGGPCPPPGAAHRYRFKLFALDTQLDLVEGATQKELEEAMQKHILGQGTLVGKYGR